MMIGSATFTPLASDFVEVSRTRFIHAIRQPRFAIRLVTLVCVAILAVGGGSVALGMDVEDAAISAATGAGVGLLALLIIIVGTYLLIPRRAARTFRQQKSAHHEMTVVWSGEELMLRTGYGETRYPWRDLHAWIDGNDVVLILASENVTYFVPKRSLDDQASHDLLTTLSASGLQRT